MKMEAVSVLIQKADTEDNFIIHVRKPMKIQACYADDLLRVGRQYFYFKYF